VFPHVDHGFREPVVPHAGWCNQQSAVEVIAHAELLIIVGVILYKW